MAYIRFRGVFAEFEKTPIKLKTEANRSKRQPYSWWDLSQKTKEPGRRQPKPGLKGYKCIIVSLMDHFKLGFHRSNYRSVILPVTLFLQVMQSFWQLLPTIGLVRKFFAIIQRWNPVKN